MTEAPERFVVVGVDGSPASHTAVRWAAKQARGLGHELLLLHAREGGRPTAFPALPPPDGDGGVPVGDADLGEELPVRRQTVEGRPSRALVEASAGATMLVLGRPRGGVSSWTGPTSLTRRVLAEAACPVVLVPERLEQ